MIKKSPPPKNYCNYQLQVRPIVKMFFLSKEGMFFKITRKSPLYYSIVYASNTIAEYKPENRIQRTQKISLLITNATFQHIVNTPGLDLLIEEVLYQKFIVFFVGFITASTGLGSTVNQALEGFYDLFDIDEDCFSFEYANYLYQKHKLI